MSEPIRHYEPLPSENAALDLIDHQVGLMTGSSIIHRRVEAQRSGADASLSRDCRLAAATSGFSHLRRIPSRSGMRRRQPTPPSFNRADRRTLSNPAWTDVRVF